MSIKILLADDSITIQKVVGIIFGGEDYSLTVVDNGKAAVEKAQEQNPDVLLIDALMPGMSGYEVCEAVRATPSLATKPILLLTGSFEPFDENKAKSCGADDFLAKPFESQQIITKVKALFDLGASRSGAPAPTAAPVEADLAAPAYAEFEIEPAVAPPIEEPASTNDIWGAFTAPGEAAEPAVEAPQSASSSVLDENIFSMVTEAPEVQTASEQAVEPPASDGTGSQWIPVEEETFEFEETIIAEPSVSAFVEPEPVIEDSAFEFSVPEPEEQAVPVVTTPLASEPEALSFEEPVPAPAPLITPEAVSSAAAIPAAMTEDQLRAALAGASKEVIERIVWEVVPDLAETMIKEAIRKIKEGM